MKYQKISKIAKGWSSYIWLAEVLSSNSEDSTRVNRASSSGKKVAIKEVREKSNRKNLAEREGKMLKLANSVGVGPKLVEANFEKNFVVYEYVEGERFFDFVFSGEFENASRKEIYFFVKELMRQCLLLDEIGLRHTQLQVGKNILVKKIFIKGKKQFVPVIIDFEKASVTEGALRNARTKSGKNFGQITSFLFYNPHGKVAEKVREKLNVKL